jgi:hypothetical protein
MRPSVMTKRGSNNVHLDDPNNLTNSQPCNVTNGGDGLAWQNDCLRRRHMTWYKDWVWGRRMGGTPETGFITGQAGQFRKKNYVDSVDPERLNFFGNNPFLPFLGRKYEKIRIQGDEF